jgi:endonuclease G, mitochondrial
MIRISWLGAFLFSFFISLIHPALSEDLGCSSQLFRGIAPSIKNAKLASQSYELCFSEIALRYSGVARTPLWSAERLTATRIGRARTLTRLRANAFHEEQRLPLDDRASLADYRRSGYDRGHMAPNGDMSTPEAQEESFSLANMIPQDPCNNEVLWEGIESAVRDLALAENEVYVVTGPAFLEADLQRLKGRVLVPTHIFKAVYVPSRHRAGAYFAPNDASQSWEAISIADLETRVGVDVFPQIDAKIKHDVMTLPSPTPHFGCRLRTTESGPQGSRGGR